MYAQMTTAQKRTIITTRFLYFTSHGEYGTLLKQKHHIPYSKTKSVQF